MIRREVENSFPKNQKTFFGGNGGNLLVEPDRIKDLLDLLKNRDGVEPALFELCTITGKQFIDVDIISLATIVDILDPDFMANNEEKRLVLSLVFDLVSSKDPKYLEYFSRPEVIQSIVLQYPCRGVSKFLSIMFKHNPSLSRFLKDFGLYNRVISDISLENDDFDEALSILSVIPIIDENKDVYPSVIEHLLRVIIASTDDNIVGDCLDAISKICEFSPSIAEFTVENPLLFSLLESENDHLISISIIDLIHVICKSMESSIILSVPNISRYLCNEIYDQTLCPQIINLLHFVSEMDDFSQINNPNVFSSCIIEVIDNGFQFNTIISALVVLCRFSSFIAYSNPLIIINLIDRFIESADLTKQQIFFQALFNIIAQNSASQHNIIISAISESENICNTLMHIQHTEDSAVYVNIILTALENKD